MDEAGSGRWLGIRFPPLCPPLTAAEASALQAKQIRAAQKHQAAVRRAEAQARKRAAATGGLLSSSNGGLCGLYNLGNTCFLNVSLQCLSQSRALTRYFRTNTFLRELNETNPLGSQGQLAMAYGTLIKQMWAARPLEAIEPKKMKLTIGKFRPQFSGNQQHDAQELLSFLLDGLHEDLNRVKKKPYIPTPDSAGRPDAVVAKEQWGNYRARDDSIIVDLYTGLLKSSLRFDKCGRVSTTFDAYTSLSLPLPKEKIKHLEVTLVWLEKKDDSNPASNGGGSKRRARSRVPTKYCIEFDSSVAFAAAATAAAAAHASKTVTAAASSTTGASSSASSASAASLSAAAAAAASATATAAALAISRPALAASTRIADIKIALSRLSGVPLSRLQMARLQLSMYDIWKRRQFHFLQNYQSVSDYALSMQAAAGPTGNKNDVYYAFEVPEPTPATKPTPQAAAPVTHVPTVGYIAADVSASSSSSYQTSLSSRPFVHDGMPASHASSASHHAAASSSHPATATPTPALVPASVSSTPSLPDNPVSHSAPYPTTFGGLGGMVQLGMKFDVKDSVAKWEIATVRDIRMLVSVQTMMEMGGKLETSSPATQQQPAPPVAARTSATHPPSALVPTLSLRKRSSAAETDAVRFSDDTSDADDDDTTKARTVPPNPAESAAAATAVAPVAAVAVAPVAAVSADAVPSKKEDEDGECIHFDDPDTDDAAGEDEVAPLAGASTKTGAAEPTAPAAAAAAVPAEQSASTKHARDVSLTATSTTLQTPTTVASQSQSSSSSLPRFSASSIPGFVYQHLPEVARKLPPDFPPVELHFGFDGFSVKWNEWVPIQSSRIAPYGSGLTKTHGRGGGGGGGANLNAAYLTGPPPAHGFGYNPLYTGSALSTLSGGSSSLAASYGYSSFGTDADVECGVIRVQVLQRCAKPVPPVTIKATVLPMPAAASSSNTLAVPVARSGDSASSPAAPAPSSTPAPDAVTGLTPSSAPVVPYDVQYFSLPLILWLDPRTTTTAQLYDLVWNKVKRFTSLPDVLTNPASASAKDQSRSASLDRAASSAQVDALEQMAAAHENGIVGTDATVSSEQINVELSPLPVAAAPPQDVAASALPTVAAAASSVVPSSVASGEPTVTASSCATLPPYFFADVTSPFKLRYSNGSGTACSRCQTYSKECTGCPIHLAVPNEERDRAEAIAAAAVIVDGDMQPVSPKPLVRDTFLISPGDRAAHVRSWHNDCTLLLDWNTDYMDAGLVDVNEQARLEIDPSVTSFRALAAREDHASKVDLNVCMSLFTQTEKLSGDAAVYCSACKTHEEATKTLELYSTPPLLVLHLKRLLPDTKLFTDVRFPLKGFDPKPFLASSHPTPAPAPSKKAEAVVVEELEEKQTAEKPVAVKHAEPVVVIEAKLPLEPTPAFVAPDSASTVAKSDETIVADVHALVKAVNSKEAVVPADASAEAAVAPAPADSALRVEVTEVARVTADGPVQTTGTTEAAAASNAVTAAPESDSAAAAVLSTVVDKPAPDAVTVAPIVVSPPPATPSPSAAAAAASSSSTPSPIPASPPPSVFTPVAGGFDASVAGGAPNGKSKSSSPDLYDLYAVVHHFGAVGGGHYIAYALDRDRGLWFRFDDAKLTQISQDKVVSNSAYMLFYERRGLSQNAGVDAVPPAIRNKALDAKGRRLLKESEGGVENCHACAMQ